MSSTQIHTTSVISPEVELGENVKIGPFVTVLGPCVIGDNTWIGANSVIGAPPEITSENQNLAWAGEIEHSGVVIEANVVIRESVIIHQGSHRATQVAQGAWILNRAYVAHDVVIGERATVSAGVSIGGHCTIYQGVNIGMNASIHQRRSIGAGAMVGMGTALTKDVPPFAKVFGSPVKLMGINTVMLERLGISEQNARALSDLYATGELTTDVFQNLSGKSLDIPELEEWLSSNPQRIISR